MGLPEVGVDEGADELMSGGGGVDAAAAEDEPGFGEVVALVREVAFEDVPAEGVEGADVGLFKARRV